MKLQGNVMGYIYPVTQQVYDEPINADRVCKWCGKKFIYDPATRLKVYCSRDCQHKGQVERQRKYNARSRKRVAI